MSKNSTLKDNIIIIEEFISRKIMNKKLAGILSIHLYVDEGGVLGKPSFIFSNGLIEFNDDRYEYYSYIGNLTKVGVRNYILGRYIYFLLCDYNVINLYLQEEMFMNLTKCDYEHVTHDGEEQCPTCFPDREYYPDNHND